MIGITRNGYKVNHGNNNTEKTFSAYITEIVMDLLRTNVIKPLFLGENQILFFSLMPLFATTA